MKKKIITGLLLILVVLILSSCSSREEKIGILDMERLLVESQRASEFQDELSRIGDQLEEDYNQKKEELSGDAEREELDRLYREYMKNKERLEEELNREVKEILTGFAEEKDLGVVLSSEGVVSGGIDITGEVIEKMDEKYFGSASESGVQNDQED